MTYLMNGGVRLPLKNGGWVMAGLSNEVPKNHLPSETYVLSNGHSISVFLPEQDLGVWNWISTKLTHFMKQVLSSLSDALHRSVNRQDWIKFRFSQRRLFHLLFPLPDGQDDDHADRVKGPCGGVDVLLEFGNAEHGGPGRIQQRHRQFL